MVSVVQVYGFHFFIFLLYKWTSEERGWSYSSQSPTQEVKIVKRRNKGKDKERINKTKYDEIKEWLEEQNRWKEKCMNVLQEISTVEKRKGILKFEDVSVWAAGFIKQPWALHPYLPHPSVAMDIRPWQHRCVCVGLRCARMTSYSSLLRSSTAGTWHLQYL